jgi:uncharacterized protein
MSERDVETVRNAYDSFNSGNIDGVLGTLDENVEWIEPGGGNAPAGTFNGPDQVGSEVFPEIQKYFEEFVCTPEDIKEQGDQIVVTGRFKGKSKSGGELDASFEHDWEMRNGKATQFENKVDQDAWAAAWS